PLNGIDTISFNPAVFGKATTMKLTLGGLLISDAVMIYGPAARLTIDGNKSQIFNIDVRYKSAQTIQISGLSLLNGGGPVYQGGAITDFDEAVTLSNCTISSCSGSSGGGVYLSSAIASLNVSDCLFNGNSATQFGGAIYGDHGSTISIARCAITNNKAGRTG